ncbi:MAG: hypothetical protein HY538_00620 [Deltaproteobacteria bacterium]|nr:hypothetical protein [Deltaproteobacteria bacterium]
MASLQQANFLMPEDVLQELRRTVPKGEQSKVVVHALRQELTRLRFLKSLEKHFGAWAKRKHPELKHGVENYIRHLRHSIRGDR